jgi:hypothetical protein
MIIFTGEDLATVDRVRVARHPAEDVDWRAASADGDVQAGDDDAQEARQDPSVLRVELARVLDVLAALSTAARRAGAAGRGGRDGADEGEGGDEDLGEHLVLELLREEVLVRVRAMADWLS